MFGAPVAYIAVGGVVDGNTRPVPIEEIAAHRAFASGSPAIVHLEAARHLDVTVVVQIAGSTVLGLGNPRVWFATADPAFALVSSGCGTRGVRP